MKVLKTSDHTDMRVSYSKKRAYPNLYQIDKYK